MRARAVVGLLLASLTVSAASAQAHGRIGLAGVVLEHKARTLASRPAPASCPAGVPVQTITVVNQSNIQPSPLAKVERAAVDQSLQARAAWRTPCVQFGPGGWVFTLTDPALAQPNGGISYQLGGHHYYAPQGVYADVETGGNDPAVWPRAFTHELVEALVDPQLTTRWRLGLVEICDPVEEITYLLDGVEVSDFALPSYFNEGAGPWDQAGRLTGPFS